MRIGVIGSAKREIEEVNIKKARELGKEISIQNCYLLTGASPGLTYEVVKEAKRNNCFTIGFSPASNLEEHIGAYGFPTDHFDFIVFTGFGLKGRNVVFIRSCDAVAMISGRIGTLNEFTIAYDEGKLIGVLTGTSGATEIIGDIVEKCRKPGGKVVFSSNPRDLVREIIKHCTGH